MDEGVDPCTTLMPEFFTERHIATLAVAIIELVAPPMTRLAADLARRADHLPDQRFGDSSGVTSYVGDLRPIRAHGRSLFVAERVGEHEMGLVAECGADKCQRDAGRSGGVFNDSASRWKPAIGNSALDHGPRHPILHASRRVRRFELGHDPARSLWHDSGELDERRIANRLQNASAGLMHRP